MFASLVVVSTLPALAFSCIASGICGGGLPGLPGLPPPGGCFNPIPPVAPPCAMGGGGVGCGPGYSCGTYGCFQVRRARAHSALTLEAGGAPSELDARPVLFGPGRFNGLRNPAFPPPPLAADPNAAFMACCESRGLPDACLAKCTYNTYTKDSLTRMFFKQDACPISASAEIQYCAAQGRDHRACCARNGVTTTISGLKCLTFCDQRPGNVTQLDMSYIGCYDRFENMKSCFWHDISSRLSNGEF